MNEREWNKILGPIIDHIRRVARDTVRPWTIGNGQYLDASSPNVRGQWPPERGGTGHDQGAEPPLPAPPGPGYVLTSAGDGTYGWLRLVAGAGIDIAINGATGEITIGTTLALDTLTFGGDDLTFGGALVGFGEA